MKITSKNIEKLITKTIRQEIIISGFFSFLKEMKLLDESQKYLEEYIDDFSERDIKIVSDKIAEEVGLNADAPEKA